MPFVIFITINNKCNMKCKTCDVGQKQPSPLYKDMMRSTQLKPGAWKAFIDQVAPYRPSFDIGTTEPLLYDGLIEVLDYMKQKQLSCCLTTNGWMLPQLAEKIANTKVEKFIVSIDGPQEIHDTIRGVKNSFERAISGIQKLKALNKNIKIGINYTISNHNYTYLKQTLEALDKEIQWDSFLFIHPSFVTNKMAQDHNTIHKGHTAFAVDVSGVELDKIDIDILRKQIADIKERYKTKDIRFHPDIPLKSLDAYYHNPSSFVTARRCVVPWRYANITSNGDVIPLNRCQMFSFGNICESDLKEVWNSSPYRDFRRRLRKFGAFPICTRCGGLAVK